MNFAFKKFYIFYVVVRILLFEQLRALETRVSRSLLTFYFFSFSLIKLALYFFINHLFPLISDYQYYYARCSNFGLPRFVTSSRNESHICCVSHSQCCETVTTQRCSNTLPNIWHTSLIPTLYYYPNVTKNPS